MKRSPLIRKAPLRRVPFQDKPRKKNPPRTIPRSRPYRKFIRAKPCLVCGGAKGKSEAAHTGPVGGMGLKGNDFRCIPLCAWHHYWDPRSYHEHPGGEKGFCREFGIDLKKVIADLQSEFHRKAGKKMKHMEAIALVFAAVVGAGVLTGFIAPAEHECGGLLEPKLSVDEHCPSQLVELLNPGPLKFTVGWRLRSSCRIDFHASQELQRRLIAAYPRRRVSIDSVNGHETWIRPALEYESLREELEASFPSIAWVKGISLGEAQ